MSDPVQAVAEALHADQCPDDECDGGDMGEWERQAEIAVAAVVQSRALSIDDAWAVLAAARPAIEREHREEWAAYIETWTGAKGAPEFTAEAIVTALRQPRPPFGKVANPGRADRPV